VRHAQTCLFREAMGAGVDPAQAGRAALLAGAQMPSTGLPRPSACSVSSGTSPVSFSLRMPLSKWPTPGNTSLSAAAISSGAALMRARAPALRSMFATAPTFPTP
jgi:hypothetical protein